MKTTSQVHRNSATKAVKSQAKTTPGKVITVIFYSDENGKEMFRADIPKAIFARCQRACKKLRISLGEFFHQAMERKIENFHRELATPSVARDA